MEGTNNRGLPRGGQKGLHVCMTCNEGRNECVRVKGNYKTLGNLRISETETSLK